MVKRMMSKHGGRTMERVRPRAEASKCRRVPEGGTKGENCRAAGERLVYTFGCVCGQIHGVPGNSPHVGRELIAWQLFLCAVANE